MANELDTDANNSQGAIARLRMLIAVRQGGPLPPPDPPTVFNQIQGTYPFKDEYVQGQNAYPSYYYALKTGKLYVFIDGVQTQRQGQAIWDGYIGPTFPNNALLTNPWFVSAAATIAAKFQPLVWNELIISGWSAGGAIAWHLAKVARELYGAQTIRVIAFGAPQAMGTGPSSLTPQNAQSPDNCHWMNSDDPVPFIPPNPGNWQRIMAGLSVVQGSRLATFRGYPNGVNIRQTLTVQEGGMPLDNTAPALSAIGAWLESQAAGTTNPHSLVVYKARLQAIFPTPVTAPVLAPVHSPQPPPQPVPQAAIRQAIAANVQLAFTDGARQNAQQAIISDDRLFVRVKVGKMWIVTFGGVQIAIAPRKKRAAALANLGNAFLRKLQNEAVVNADDLGQQFLNYLLAAQDPGSGIVPTMNTQL